jgi:hypothetical protein
MLSLHQEWVGGETSMDKKLEREQAKPEKEQ